MKKIDSLLRRMSHNLQEIDRHCGAVRKKYSGKIRLCGKCKYHVKVSIQRVEKVKQILER